MKTALLIPGLLLQSQGFMFASDKIYTVLIVVLLVWAGILTFLVFTGRKLGRIEKEMSELQSRSKPQKGKNG